MTSDSTPARPRQLTLAAWFVVGGSLFVLVSAFDGYSKVDSVDTRDEVARLLDGPAGQGLGLSVAQGVDVLRVALTVLAVCAVAAAVLGWFVLQRHHGARIVLSVLAVPILVVSTLTGDLMGTLVAAATLSTWSGQARDWFAGRPVREAPPGLFGPRSARAERGAGGPGAGGSRPGTERAARPSSAESPSTARPSDAPGETRGFGAAPPPPPEWPGARTAAAYAPTGGGPDQRPYVVTVACALTWIFSGLLAAVMLGFLVALAVDPSPFVDQITGMQEWKRLNFSDDLLVPALVVDGLLFLVWSLGACVLAWFAWRRHNWARYLLVASAVAALLAALFAFPLGMLHQLACALTIGGLLGRASRTWFTGPRSSGPGAPGGPPSGPARQDGPPTTQDHPVGGGRPSAW